MKTRSHFAHRIDMLDAAGEIQEHLAGVEDYTTRRSPLARSNRAVAGRNHHPTSGRSSRGRGPKPDRRRALELLVASRDGRTEAIMIAHGFAIEQMIELVRAGLAAATAERVVAGAKAIEVARVKITEAGRRALA